MERHIIDSVKILGDAHRKLSVAGMITTYPWTKARHTLVDAIRYLSNPDRYMRPKRGTSNVKTSQRKNG